MDWGATLAMIGLGVMVGLAGCGSAIGTSIGGAAVIGMLKKKPELFGNGLILAALPGTQGLYGFVGFILYQGALGGMGGTVSVLQGAVVFGAGLALGLACLISAIQQGNVCANGIAAMGSGHNVFGNTFILAVFPEFYAILSLVAAILAQALLKA